MALRFVTKKALVKVLAAVISVLGVKVLIVALVWLKVQPPLLFFLQLITASPKHN